jgi:peptidoglycan LD-endopeptidase CwlK
VNIFDVRSLNQLRRVHPHLVVAAVMVLREADFIVTCGARTREAQQALVNRGASWTMDSRHLIGPDGLCHALDIAVRLDGEVRWDWPLYEQVAQVWKRVADQSGIPIEWGGDWVKRDGPHYQLAKAAYP